MPEPEADKMPESEADIFVRVSDWYPYHYSRQQAACQDLDWYQSRKNFPKFTRGIFGSGGMGAPGAPMIQQAGRGERLRTVRMMPGARRQGSCRLGCSTPDYRAPRVADNYVGRKPRADHAPGAPTIGAEGARERYPGVTRRTACAAAAIRSPQTRGCDAARCAAHSRNI